MSLLATLGVVFGVLCGVLFFLILLASTDSGWKLLDKIHDRLPVNLPDDPGNGAKSVFDLKTEIETGCVGAGLTAVRLAIRSHSPYTRKVGVATGTTFLAQENSVQDMVSTTNVYITIPELGQAVLTVPVACLNMRKLQPTSEHHFPACVPPSRSDLPKDLKRLLSSEPFHISSPRIRQFAVWAITDNSAPWEFASIVSSQEDKKDGPPSIEEINEVRILLATCGVSPQLYRVFTNAL